MFKKSMLCAAVVLCAGQGSVVAVQPLSEAPVGFVCKDSGITFSYSQGVLPEAAQTVVLKPGAKLEVALNKEITALLAKRISTTILFKHPEAVQSFVVHVAFSSVTCDVKIYGAWEKVPANVLEFVKKFVAQKSGMRRVAETTARVVVGGAVATAGLGYLAVVAGRKTRRLGRARLSGDLTKPVSVCGSSSSFADDFKSKGLVVALSARNATGRRSEVTPSPVADDSHSGAAEVVPTRLPGVVAEAGSVNIKIVKEPTVSDPDEAKMKIYFIYPKSTQLYCIESSATALFKALGGVDIHLFCDLYNEASLAVQVNLSKTSFIAFLRSIHNIPKEQEKVTATEFCKMKKVGGGEKTRGELSNSSLSYSWEISVSYDQFKFGFDSRLQASHQMDAFMSDPRGEISKTLGAAREEFQRAGSTSSHGVSSGLGAGQLDSLL